MKQRSLLLALLLGALLFASCNKSLTPSDYVNPLVGTDFHGHTYPGAIVPFGMIQPGPDTRLEGWDGCSGYHYSDFDFYGFSHTHLNGTGCSDYGDVLIMPFSENYGLPKGKLDEREFHYTFSHDSEEAHPGYYKVRIDPEAITAELTCDERVACHHYSFNPSYDMPYRYGFIINLDHRDKLLSGGITMLGDLIVGYRESAAWNPDQHLYFAISCDQPFDQVEYRADSTQAIFYFAQGVKEATLYVAISSVDTLGAIRNLHYRPFRPFDEMRQEADSVWNKELSKIEIKGGTKEQKRCFYTALYHCFTSPYLFSDVDGRYRGQDNQIHHAEGSHQVYTVFSLWDTYRALHPLLTILDHKRTEDFIYTFLRHYEQGGELTMWELSAYETHCMIGYHAAPVILEAYKAGILDKWADSDKCKLLEAMIATANLPMLGRPEYAENGYLSSELENESVSKTLEYAYDDWCIAQYARLLRTAGLNADPNDSIYNTYVARSQSWKHILDPDGFMHPRRNGGFITPFDPTEINNHYTEANSWQYSTYVPHDVYGWIEMIGGPEKVEQLLDSMFFGSSKLSGRDQVDVTGLIGQYAHGNEPSHHAAYLYTYIGHPEKTQQIVSRILNEFYTSKPDGLCGNEDCGQMSAWYVLSAMGFYPVCPGSGEYVTVKPLFKNIVVHRGDGTTMNIDQKTWQAGKFYRDGQFFEKSISELAARERITPIPYFSDWKQRFDGEADITLKVRGDAQIYYTLDDSVPDTNSTLYTKPIRVSGDITITAVAYSPLTGYSKPATQQLTKFVTDKKLTYITKPDPQYYENGEEGLVDRLWGKPNYKVGGWQGWTGDMEVVIDLLSTKAVHKVGVSCLEDTRSWIFFPSAIEVSTSVDGKDYKPFAKVSTGYTPLAEQQGTASIQQFSSKGSANARYVKLKVCNYGKMPQWHVSAGEHAWLFIDEVIVD